jgi:hypothetical protein
MWTDIYGQWHGMGVVGDGCRRPLVLLLIDEPSR